MMLQKYLLEDLRAAMVALGETDWKSAGFTMAHWAKGKLPETPLLGCGTACCAYGVGITLPSWQKVGLRLIENHSQTTFLAFIAPTTESMDKLGLNYAQWIYIFGGALAYGKEPADITPMEVVSHIDHILSGRYIFNLAY